MRNFSLRLSSFFYSLTRKERQVLEIFIKRNKLYFTKKYFYFIIKLLLNSAGAKLFQCPFLIWKFRTKPPYDNSWSQYLIQRICDFVLRLFSSSITVAQNFIETFHLEQYCKKYSLLSAITPCRTKYRKCINKNSRSSKHSALLFFWQNGFYAFPNLWIEPTLSKVFLY